MPSPPIASPRARASWPITVYLAEDDPDLRATLALLLRRDGHFVVEARDGIDLLTDLTWAIGREPARLQDFLVVTDQRMPVAHGLSVMRSLKRAGACPAFILMTAFATPAVRAEATRMGAMAVLDKPFDVDELRDLVNRRSAERRSAGMAGLRGSRQDADA